MGIESPKFGREPIKGEITGEQPEVVPEQSKENTETEKEQGGAEQTETVEGDAEQLLEVERKLEEIKEDTQDVENTVKEAKTIKNNLKSSVAEDFERKAVLESRLGAIDEEFQNKIREIGEKYLKIIPILAVVTFAAAFTSEDIMTKSVEFFQGSVADISLRATQYVAGATMVLSQLSGFMKISMAAFEKRSKAKFTKKSLNKLNEKLGFQ